MYLRSLHRHPYRIARGLPPHIRTQPQPSGDIKHESFDLNTCCGPFVHLFESSFERPSSEDVRFQQLDHKQGGHA